MDDKDLVITDEGLGALLRFQPGMLQSLQDASFHHNDVSTVLLSLAIKAAQLTQLAQLQHENQKVNSPDVNYALQLDNMVKVASLILDNIRAAKPSK